jgi:hypothetical protein
MVLGRPDVADYKFTGWRLEMGRKRMGADWADSDSGPCIGLRVHQKGSWLPKRYSLEGGSCRGRLRRRCVACRSNDPHHDRVPGRNHPAYFPSLSQPGGSSDGSFAIFSFAITSPQGDAHAIAESTALTFAGTGCFSGGSCTAAASTTASAEHVRRASESVGLQLL